MGFLQSIINKPPYHKLFLHPDFDDPPKTAPGFDPQAKRYLRLITALLLVCITYPAILPRDLQQWISDYRKYHNHTHMYSLHRSKCWRSALGVNPGNWKRAITRKHGCKGIDEQEPWGHKNSVFFTKLPVEIRMMVYNLVMWRDVKFGKREIPFTVQDGVLKFGYPEVVGYAE